MARRELTRRCAPRLARSPAPRTFGNHVLREAASQPARSAAVVAARTRPRKCRRLRSGRAIRMLTLYDIAAGDHGAQIIDDSADENFKHMHQHEGDEGPGGNEMQGARGLPSADDIDPSGHD